MKFSLSIVGLALTWVGLLWAAGAILADWRRRRLGDLPGVAAARRVRDWLGFAPEPNRGTLAATLPAITSSFSTGRATLKKGVLASAPWQEQLEARLFNLEQWQEDSDARHADLGTRLAAEEQARSHLIGQVAAVSQRLEDAERRERELTKQARSTDLLGVLLALTGAALSSIAGILPS